MINATAITTLPELVVYVNGLTGGYTFSFLLMFITIACFFIVNRLIPGRTLSILLGTLFLNTLLAGLLVSINIVDFSTLLIYIAGTIACFIAFITHNN